MEFLVRLALLLGLANFERRIPKYRSQLSVSKVTCLRISSEQFQTGDLSCLPNCYAMHNSTYIERRVAM